MELNDCKLDVGTVEFTAPEVVKDEEINKSIPVAQASDMFSLGATFYHMLTQNYMNTFISKSGYSRLSGSEFINVNEVIDPINSVSKYYSPHSLIYIIIG